MTDTPAMPGSGSESGSEPPQPNQPDPAALEAKLTMGIDPYERNWMRLSVVLLIVFFSTVSIAGFAMGFQVNGAESEVDPRTVMDSGPWASPGLREISPGKYEAYVIALAWRFEPRELEVPVGSTVDIFVTSPDLQHGFKITDTNVNMMVVPGQVSKMTYSFDEVGEFPYLCHEYCGRGHATMFGVVNVVPASTSESPEPDNPEPDNPEPDTAEETSP